jgi:phosphohistidine phosphatase
LKQLFIIRHAKSDQSFFGNDFERPLNERGRSDAPVMAKRLLDKKYTINALVSSPAVRAKRTAELFAETLNLPLKEIVFISALYHARDEVFYEVIAGLSDELETVAIFSHNPGITLFVNSLETAVQIDNMPTCAIFAVSADTINWSGFSKAKKTFLFFDHPKKVL